MASNKSDGAAAAALAEAPEPITVTINEFCTRLSETVIRPELLGGFANSERALGNARDTEAAYRARYEYFVNKAV